MLFTSSAGGFNAVADRCIDIVIVPLGVDGTPLLLSDSD